MMPAKKRYTDAELRAHKNARSAQRYRENKEKIAAYHAALHASRSNDADYMRKMAEKSAAYRMKNPDVVKLQNARRRAADPEKAKRESREWFALHPEKRVVYQQNRQARMRANGGIVSLDIKDKLMKAQRGRCACCRVDLKTVVVNLDHIIPIVLGGKNSDENIQLLCRTCNNQKYAKHPVDFMQQKGFLL